VSREEKYEIGTNPKKTVFSTKHAMTKERKKDSFRESGGGRVPSSNRRVSCRKKNMTSKGVRAKGRKGKKCQKRKRDFAPRHGTPHLGDS